MTVTLQFLRLQRTALLVWGAVLVLMVFGVTSATPAVTAGNGLEVLIKSLGPAIRQMAGGDIRRFASPVDAYIVMKLLMFLPALVGVFVVLATGAVVAREQAQGTLDFLLSLPLDRATVLRQRFLGVVGATALLYAAVWLCLAVGLETAGVPGSYGRYALALVGAYAVNMAQAGFVLVLSVALHEYAHVVRYGLALVLGTYLFGFVLQAGGVLTWLQNVLLYGLANPFPAVADGQFPWGAVLAGSAGVALGLIWGGRIFSHRELQ
jgi:ABC-type transport system involved in multi-copper enzyme maturation permease subunit